MDLSESFQALPWVLVAVGGVLLAWTRLRAFILEAPMKRAELEHEVEELQAWRKEHESRCRAEHKEILDAVHDLDKKVTVLLHERPE